MAASGDIRLNHGVPLAGAGDMDALYVPLDPQAETRLRDWWVEPDAGPLVVLGQLGCGKTTLINAVLASSGIPPDLTLYVDAELPAFSSAAVWGYALARAYIAAQGQIPLEPYDLIAACGKRVGSIDEAVRLLAQRAARLADSEAQRDLHGFLDGHLDLARRQLGGLLAAWGTALGRRPFVFVEGLDKLDEERPEYQAVLPLLNDLAGAKTLYEANLVQAIGRSQPWKARSGYLYLTAADPETVVDLLGRRMGMYARDSESALRAAAELSGGNPRQAVRLLLEYEYARGRLAQDHAEALAYAGRRVAGDLLKTSALRDYVALLRVVQKEGHYIPVLEHPEPLLWNWLLVTEEPVTDRWPVRINPLVEPMLLGAKEGVPEEPEQQMLVHWAQAHGISPVGLETGAAQGVAAPRAGGTDAAARAFQRWLDELGDAAAAPLTLNITEVFEWLASFFLDSQRHELYVIVYADEDVARLANDYLVGRAGSFRPFNYLDRSLDTPLEVLEPPGEAVLGESVFFPKAPSRDDLAVLDARRDALLGRRMLWWIREPDVAPCLDAWPHLRQLVRIVRLDERLADRLTDREVEDDLDQLDQLFPQAEERTDLARRLRRVLGALRTGNRDGRR